MKLPILKVQETKGVREFIDYWKKLYLYKSPINYEEIIEKESFLASDIKAIFEWKNGMKLSKQKQKTLETKILSKLKIINQLKSSTSFDLDSFRIEFKNLSAVWKIFLLHIIDPKVYPIYDQHIHRSFNFIQNKEWKGITNSSISNKRKEEFYFETFLPFVSKLRDFSIRDIDKALFAFGKFIKESESTSKIIA